MQIDPKRQFSKRLARWTAVFWFVFMSWLSVLFMLSPEAALYCVYMGIVVTVVMLINVISYTRNSIAEKMAFALLDKTRLELTLGKGASGTDKDESDEEGTEEGENG